ncbi:hypothetical protein MMC27_007095 [Xylographa pallens]|nr:hypothetical protein [Xylographa pallens]
MAVTTHRIVVPSYRMLGQRATTIENYILSKQRVKRQYVARAAGKAILPLSSMTSAGPSMKHANIIFGGISSLDETQHEDADNPTEDVQYQSGDEYMGIHQIVTQQRYSHRLRIDDVDVNLPAPRTRQFGDMLDEAMTTSS